MFLLRIDGVCLACFSSSPSHVFAYCVHVSYSSSYLDMFKVQPFISFYGTTSDDCHHVFGGLRFMLTTHKVAKKIYIQVDLKLGITTVDGSEIRLTS